MLWKAPHSFWHMSTLLLLFLSPSLLPHTDAELTKEHCQASVPGNQSKDPSLHRSPLSWPPQGCRLCFLRAKPEPVGKAFCTSHRSGLRPASERSGPPRQLLLGGLTLCQVSPGPADFPQHSSAEPRLPLLALSPCLNGLPVRKGSLKP